MSACDLINLRLHNQGLSTHCADALADIVHRLCAVQAQDYAASKWGIGMRMKNATDADVDDAFDTGSILRTHLLRPTWHFVTPGDIRWLMSLTAPRVHAANAYMYRKLGLDATIRATSEAAIVRGYSEDPSPRTRDQLAEVFENAGIDTKAEFRLGYLLMHAELEGILCSGPRTGKHFTYALMDHVVPSEKPLPRDEALAKLAARYYTSRGPATLDDFAKWSGLTKKDVRAATELARVGERTYGGTVYFAFPESGSLPEHSTGAHLMSIYDEYISGYRDHSAIADSAIQRQLGQMGNALQNVLLIDGRIAGTYRRTPDRGRFKIDGKLLRPLTARESSAVAAAGLRYESFVQKPLVMNWVL